MVSISAQETETAKQDPANHTAAIRKKARQALNNMGLAVSESNMQLWVLFRGRCLFFPTNACDGNVLAAGGARSDFHECGKVQQLRLVRNGHALS